MESEVLLSVLQPWINKVDFADSACSRWGSADARPSHSVADADTRASHTERNCCRLYRSGLSA